MFDKLATTCMNNDLFKLNNNFLGTNYNYIGRYIIMSLGKIFFASEQTSLLIMIL